MNTPAAGSYPCECPGSYVIYGDDDLCVKCKGVVEADTECHSCKGALDVVDARMCSACITKYAEQANRVARRLLGCPPEGPCAHTMKEGGT